MTAEKQINGTAPFGYLCKIGILQGSVRFSIMITNAPIAACVFKEQADYQEYCSPIPAGTAQEFPGQESGGLNEFIHPYGYYGLPIHPEIPHISSYETNIIFHCMHSAYQRDKFFNEDICIFIIN